ncbi:hypothetical protein QEM11_001926 [Pseudomonas putida]|nr:hypothetical protein [Pseudomonas putida]
MAIVESPLAGLVSARHAQGGVAARLKQRAALNASIIGLLPPTSPSATDVLLSSSAALFLRGTAPTAPFSSGLVTQKCV